jgi:Transposase DDE domain group 1
MKTITYEAAEKQAESVSVLLMAVLEYAKGTPLFSWLDRVKVPMKTVTFSPLNKAQTMIASLVMGCKHTQDINEMLPQELAAANYLGMPRFPEQSQINRYLTRFSADNVAQLREAHAQVFMQQSQARRAVGQIVVDIDQCGLVANGQTYEFARKGYFPHKRGEQGYQVSAAYVGAYEEAVQIYLDAGNVVSKQRLPDLLRDIDRQLAVDNPGVVLIRRLDAGYDSSDNRRLLADLPGYFLMKSAEGASAAALAQRIPLHRWLPVADGVHGVELPAYDGVRRVLYEFALNDGTCAYSILLSNLPVADFGVLRLFHFYNERQTIEAFFCQSRHVFHIQTLRSRQFNAIYAFLHFVFLTHNLLVWVKQARFAHTPLAAVSMRQLVGKLTHVRAHITWDGQWHLFILDTHHWAQRLLDALQPHPHPVQLPLPFARLHKT